MTGVLREIRAPAVALTILLALFLLLPTILVFSASITAGEFLSFPPEGVSARWYVEVATDPAWLKALGLSLQTSLAGAAIATVAGTAAALGIRRLLRGAEWFRALFIAPIVLPYVVYALGLYSIVDALRQIGNPVWLVLGQAALAFPLVFVTVSAGLANVAPNVTRAAESLGAPWPMTVAAVELPLIRGNVVGGALLAFVFCFDELMVPLFIGDVDMVPFSLQIYRSMRESVSPSVAAASVLVIVLALLGCVIAAWIIGRARRAIATEVTT